MKKILSFLSFLLLLLGMTLLLAACGDNTVQEPEPELSECEKNGHRFASEVNVIREATCTESGLSAKICLVCNEVVQETTPALGHLEKTIPAKPATCTENGHTEGKVCERCDAVLVEQTIVLAGHSYDEEWTVYKLPDRTGKGSAYLRCQACGDYLVLENEVPALTEDGYALTVEADGTVYAREVEGRSLRFKIFTFVFKAKDDSSDESILEQYNGTDAEVTIPATTPDGRTVRAIGESVFRDNTTLTKVTIPETVAEIGNGAFAGCTSLQSVVLPDALKVLPEEVFSGCSALSSVNFPGELTEIGESAFYHCTSLTALRLSEKMSKVGRSAFEGCTALEAVIFDESDIVVAVKSNAFSFCTALKTFVSNAQMFPSALGGCNALASLKVHCIEQFLSDSDYIGGYATALGELFTAEYRDGNKNEYSVPESLKEVILTSQEYLNGWVFENCKYLEKIEILSAGDIDSHAFSGCSALKEVIVEEADTFGRYDVFGEPLFDNCTSLEKVTLKKTGAVGREAFKNCVSIKEVYLDVKYIGTESFYGCTTLASVTFTEELKSIDGQAFGLCNALKTITLPSGLEYIGYNAFANCLNLEEVSIGGVEVIEEYAFYQCGKLKKISVGSRLKTIARQAFADCTALTTVYIPDTIEKVDYETTFSSCESLSLSKYENGLYLGNESNKYILMLKYERPESGSELMDFSVKDGTRIVLLDDRFSSYYRLKLPSSVVYIAGTRNWESPVAIFDGTATDWLLVNAEFVFSSLTFSDGRTAKEITAIELDESFTSLPDMKQFSNLKSITIPATLDSVSASLSIDTVYYHGTVEQWCNLKHFYIQAKHFYLLNENNAYYEPTVIVIPDNIESISEQFYGLESVKIIVLPKNLTGILVNSSRGNSFNKNTCVIYFAGTYEEFIKSPERKALGKVMSVYYYSETEQTPDGYAKNPEMRWHYNENHEPVVWNVPGNTLDGKTFVYSTTVVRVSDEYFAMLKEAQRQNMLEDLFDNDTVQINMVKNSATKAEYEQKLSAFAAAAGQDESISFADGKLTLSQAGGASVTLDYIELNSRVYVNIGGTYSEYMAIDEESGTLREDSSNEYVTILHIFAEAE